MSINQKTNRQFKCNSCGGELELQNKRTQYVACPYCGSVADASSDAFKVLTTNGNPSNFQPRTLLKIGLVGKIRNNTYKIIGRTCWKSNYQEYWAEDGGAGYSSEQWTFDEWLLLDEDGGYLSIIEDSEGFSFSESIIPKYPSIPVDTKIDDFYTGNSNVATEYGKSEIMYFEGESTYQINIGDSASFSQYSLSKTDYIAEWRFDENNKLKEVEFFKESPVSKGELQAAFSSDEDKAKIIAAYEAKVKVRKTNKRIFLFGGLINLVLGIVLFALSPAGDDEPVFKESFSGQSALAFKADNQVDSINYLVAKSDKTFKVVPSDKTLSITFNAVVPAESEAVYKLQVIDSKNSVVFNHSTFSCNYKKYKNSYDAVADGSFQNLFILDNQEGDYHVQLVLEVPKLQAAYRNSGISADVEISVSGEKHSSALFVGVGVLMLFISLFIRKPKKMFNFWHNG